MSRACAGGLLRTTRGGNGAIRLGRIHFLLAGRSCPYERRPFPFVRRCPFVRLGLSLRATRRTAGTSSFPLGAAMHSAAGGRHPHLHCNKYGRRGEDRREREGRGGERR